MQIRQRNVLPLLTILLLILAVLLTILASFAILYVILALLHRFSQTILLFVLGAILAYILAPLVDVMQHACRKRWAAIVMVYLLVAVAVLLLGFLLFTPFVQQSQSLIKGLRNPSQDSLQSIGRVQKDLAVVGSRLESEQARMRTSGTVSPAELRQTKTALSGLQASVGGLGISSQPAPFTSHPLGKLLPESIPQTRLPPSYIAEISTPIDQMMSDYGRSSDTTGKVDPTLLARAVSDEKRAVAATGKTRDIVSSTPLLLLRMQGWLDSHSIQLDLHQHFGKAIQQLNDQAASILNSVVSILLTAGNLLVNTMLVLIISIYFLGDGANMIRRAVTMAPLQYRDEATFFVTSLNRVLGGYLRGQIVLAALAGLLGGVGAWLLGVPYAVLIGLSTTFLSLVPVIGAVILILPPFAIALVFTPLPTPIFLLVYFVVFMQIVTNIIGPRVMGSAVGIHPLEAMAAALIGYPLAGFLGSFFAVPTMGLLHIVGTEAYRHFRQDRPAGSAASGDTGVEQPAMAAGPALAGSPHPRDA